MATPLVVRVRRKTDLNALDVGLSAWELHVLRFRLHLLRLRQCVGLGRGHVRCTLPAPSKKVDIVSGALVYKYKEPEKSEDSVGSVVASLIHSFLFSGERGDDDLGAKMHVWARAVAEKEIGSLFLKQVCMQRADVERQ